MDELLIMLTRLLMGLGHLALILVAAPLLQGFIKKSKAFWQMRQGPSVLQPYRDLRKLLQKEELISEHASWIFLLTPRIALAGTLMAGLVIPNAWGWAPLNGWGDLFLFGASLGLVRLFLTLAGLEGAGTFGGMGSSRELFVGLLTEPALLLGLIVLAFITETTSLQGITSALVGVSPIFAPRLLVLLALGIVSIAEMGRIPVDNPDTHLELTMIHEGMLLEYSGTSLALLSFSEQIKQLLLLCLLAQIVWPSGLISGSIGLVGLLWALGFAGIKVAVLGFFFATVESLFVKRRLFLLPGYLATSTATAILALVSLWFIRGQI
ncbi:membrane-bound (NiFe)-hydrogenase (Ehf-type, Group 4f), transmembrane subunit B [Candidatus Desulfosporosinus infrequens]|uniref:Membrane-bound (NiFe)-hydrogenase (Ehf-type, Group 4f), transmembrane subunit B n=1 Tax=Candidatus Desulfosporosinus infrequens TaxID=2043169 RepID=A0A2U3LUJ9_9FIRM|nr:membrane-bound (NiFe)-hydrogenase (Ehf-type, Group 4f), transmembrane subunit B [Candidatus Desulfosporosinus infrequens]